MTRENDAAPLLPAAYASAFVSYWLPMDGRKFMSSGNVWFDYAARCFRIDGLFNPWDVEGTQQHLWQSELTHYGQGVSYQIKLLYDRVRDEQAGTYTIRSRSLVLEQMGFREAIFPQDYLVEAGARWARADVLLGLDVDVWELPAGNRLGMREVFLRAGGNELVRMVQQKRGDVVVRDFPNLVSGPIPASVFDPKNHDFVKSGS